jgi:hypothetical protein
MLRRLSSQKLAWQNSTFGFSGGYDRNGVAAIASMSRGVGRVSKHGLRAGRVLYTNGGERVVFSVDSHIKMTRSRADLSHINQVIVGTLCERMAAARRTNSL